MGVVMTFIKTKSESVQHGALLAESGANPIIGKTYAAATLKKTATRASQRQRKQIHGK